MSVKCNQIKNVKIYMLYIKVAIVVVPFFTAQA